MKKETPLSNELLKTLRDSGSHLSLVYYHILSCMPLEELEYSLEYAYELSQGRDSNWKEAGKTEWFRIFHKSMRQTDFFDGIYREIELTLLSKEDYSRFIFLRDIVRADGFVKNSEVKGKLFVKEYHEYLDLAEKYRVRKQHISLGGHLDMILWNTINADNKAVLYNTMEGLFEDYKDGFVK